MTKYVQYPFIKVITCAFYLMTNSLTSSSFLKHGSTMFDTMDHSDIFQTFPSLGFHEIRLFLLSFYLLPTSLQSLLLALPSLFHFSQLGTLLSSIHNVSPHDLTKPFGFTYYLCPVGSQIYTLILTFYLSFNLTKHLSSQNHAFPK